MSRINPNDERALPTMVVCNPTKFHEKHLKCFCIILPSDKWTLVKECNIRVNKLNFNEIYLSITRYKQKTLTKLLNPISRHVNQHIAKTHTTNNTLTHHRKQQNKDE